MKKIMILIAMMVLMSSIVLGATVELSFDKTTVLPGDTITLTYTQSSSQSYGFIQTIPTGWSASGVSDDGKYRTYIDDGSSTSLIIKAPSSTGTYTFNGEYFVYPATDYTSFSSQVITVSSTTNGNNGTTTDDSNNTLLYIIIGLFIFGGIYFLSQK